MTGFPQAGERAPEISLPGIPEGCGHLLVVFYKDTCPTCQYTMPFVERIHRELAPRGGRIVAIAQDDAARTKAFAETFGITMPVLVDAPDYAASTAYGLQIVPSVFVVETPAGGGAPVVRRAFAGFSRKLLVEAAGDLAASVGAPPPEVFQPTEHVLDSKPG
ncbi:MAG: TlpA family protein disulfide reductase [Acidobacteria bacterium]|nr:TlpA family protein disulfide reductase [Acidobacteriota bacterium]